MEVASALNYRQESAIVKEQFNVRIPSNLKETAVAIAEALRFSREEMAEIAWASLFGTQDAEILAKRQKVEKLVKELGLSFDFSERQLAA